MGNQRNRNNMTTAVSRMTAATDKKSLFRGFFYLYILS